MFIRKSYISNIEKIKFFNESLFKLVIRKGETEFVPGQHISIGLNGIGSREYSIASGINDKYFEVLIRKIQNGKLTPSLSKLKPNDSIEIGDPVGYFSLPTEFIGKLKKDINLIATGTGLAPFRCFSKSYENNRFKLLHGISNEFDNLKHELNDNVDYISCSRKIINSDYKGRVTDYLENEITENNDALYFLCGNGSMIYDAYKILSNKNVKSENIFYEEYF